jgi:hypothetical protein
VVAIQGSATASAPHLVLSLDTRGRAGVTVRLLARDIDATAHDAVEPVAVQYRVGAAGPFATVPGGYVADATGGPSEATRVSRVSVNLPVAADGQPLVEVRVITTNAVGQDEWVGIDDTEVVAGGGGDCSAPPVPGPESPVPGPGPAPTPGPAPKPGPKPVPAPKAPREAPPELSGLALAPATFRAAKRGPAILHRGRAGTGLRFRLSRAAPVRFEVVRGGGAPEEFAPKPDSDRLAPKAHADRFAPKADADRFALKARADRFATGASGARAPSIGGRFSARGRRGLNRLRFSGRVRGRPLAEGAYVLEAVAVDRAGRKSASTAVRFRIGAED